jgi:hypothetical protein
VSEYDPSSPDRTVAESGLSVAGNSGGTAEVPPTSTSSPTAVEKERRCGVRRTLSDRKAGWAVAAVLTCAVAGLSACSAAPSTTPASSSATSASPSAPAGHGAPRSGAPGGSGPGGGSNARSGPAAGGAVGTAGSVSTSGFTLSTAGGQQVTIAETSSTTYEQGSNSASASAVTTGAAVLVLGTVDNTTITATQVIVGPPEGDGSATAASAGVIPFKQGTPSPSKQVGQIPANYSEGDGTIVGGTTADQATEAALAAYPGGVVDRVVQLGNGEYEVHNIGVNWPHHIFVGQDFKVLGAE